MKNIKSKLFEPKKKTDKELYDLLTTKVLSGDYVFKNHTRQRMKDREITDLEVLDILEGKKGRKRNRNKKKDKYEIGREDWNYCIEGVNPDDNKIRIIVSFEKGLLPIITVMWI